MGKFHKEIVGTYMGDAGDKTAQREGSGLPKSGEFKKDAILPGLPGRGDDFPKAGKDQAASFQMLRENDIKKGSV